MVPIVMACSWPGAKARGAGAGVLLQHKRTWYEDESDWTPGAGMCAAEGQRQGPGSAHGTVLLCRHPSCQRPAPAIGACPPDLQPPLHPSACPSCRLHAAARRSAASSRVGWHWHPALLLRGCSSSLNPPPRLVPAPGPAKMPQGMLTRSP